MQHIYIDIYIYVLLLIINYFIIILYLNICSFFATAEIGDESKTMGCS